MLYTTGDDSAGRAGHLSRFFGLHQIPRSGLMSLFFLLVLAWIRCSLDSGLEPLRSGIQGTVVFKGEWPDRTDKVVVVAAYVFPPQGPADLALSDPLPLNSDSAAFHLVLPPGDYPIVGVLWKELGQPYEVTNICGLYFEHPSDFMPGVVRIPDRGTVVTGVRIEADFQRVHYHSQSRVQGTIFFRGTPPEDLEELRLIASTRFPPANLFDLRIGATVDFSAHEVDYDFPLSPDEYALLGLVAKLKGEDWDPANIIGLYLGPDPLTPGKIVVPSPDAVVQDIDFAADFARIRRETESGVRGTVYFAGPVPQDGPDGILIASTTYPPESLLDVILGPSVPIRGDSSNFEFPLSPGRYRFLALLLPGESGSLDLSSLADYYRDPEDSLMPGIIEITDAHTWVGPIRLKVDFSVGAIEGTVRFHGEWPPNTEFVRVAAFDIIPHEIQDYFQVKGFTDPLPFGVEAAPYHMKVPPGTYKWIIVVWKALNTSLMDIKQIGLYMAPGDTLQPGSVVVGAGQVVAGVDIDADFSNLPGLGN